MEVSKQQMINGVSRYVKNEVLGKITDRPFRVGMAAAVSILEAKPQLADKLLENEMVSWFFECHDDMCCIDNLEVIARTLDEQGDIPIRIGGIKFISPEDKELLFSGNDIRKLKDYIAGGY